MAFFRKWKANYKHKKFTSDECIDGEDWGLDKPSKPGQKSDDMKLRLEEDSENAGAAVESNSPVSVTFEVKYLGCTPIETKRSEKVVSEAIKTVIANSKAGGRKNKTLKRVKLILSNEGIEVVDAKTEDKLMKFSIYKISYCSVDAAHDHAFTFVSSETDPLSDRERMSCHVFHCPKRKIAHEITLMVACCFEDAYQHWRDSIEVQSKGHRAEASDNTDANKIFKEHNSCGVIEAKVEVYQHQNGDEFKSDNPLIDLAASDNDVRKFLQNTWVSFEDEPHETRHIAAC